MKVLFISLKADFGASGNTDLGYSYEYSHIYHGWRELESDNKAEVTTWWIDQSDPNELAQMIREGNFDIIFSLPVNWHNDAPFELLNEAEAKGIPIVQFDCDPLRRLDNPGDPWIYDRFKRKLATHFLCPAPHMIPQYKERNMPVEVLHFGCPDWLDRVHVDKQDIDVSFVGQHHGIRGQVVDQLREAGIQVQTFGHFWPAHPDSHGRVLDQEMADIFCRSKVNLNFTWISQPPFQHQIKGRHPELVGAGAYQIATYGETEMQGVEDIADPGSDFIQVFTVEEMIDEIRWALDNDQARQLMADKVYARREENLWSRRLEEFMEKWPTFGDPE